MEKSKLEIAYEYVQSRSKVSTFKQLWAYVCKVKGLSEEEALKQVSVFYSSLLQDGRFISVGDGKIDLKSRYSVKSIKKYDKLIEDFEKNSNDDSDEDVEDDIKEAEKSFEIVDEVAPRNDFGDTDEENEEVKPESNDDED